MQSDIPISNRQWEAAFEQAAVGMAILEAAKSRYVRVNRRFCDMVGYSAKELMQRSIRDITHPDDLDMDLEHVGQISTRTAGESSWEKRYLKKDGTVVWTRVFVAPLESSEGGPNLRLAVIEDISHLKHAEEILQESEEKFRLLIENAPDVIYLHMDGRFLYLNPAALSLFGADTADQLIGSSIMDRYSPDYHGTIAERLRELYEKRNILQIMEQVYLRLDGSSVPVEAHAVPIAYKGKNAGLTFARDISERRRAQTALQESEARFRQLVENAKDIVFRTDETGRFTFVNPAVLRITGYKENEIVGRHYPSFIRPDLRNEATKFFEHQMVTRIQNSYYECPILTKEGQEVWLGQNVQLLLENGHVKGFQSVSRDITKRRQAEEALKESEEKFRTIFDQAIDGILIADAVTQKFHQGNPSICAMLGYTKEEIENLSIADIHPRNKISHVLDEFEKMIRGEKTLVEGLPVLRKDGTVFYADISSTAATFGGRHHLVGIFRDITERKQMEEALLESEKKFRELSIVDELTQLYNSRQFFIHLKTESERSNRYHQPLTLLMLDIDNFKIFNDTYGHVAGDRVLRRLGEMVKRCLRKTDYAYRYGGEEFAFLLPMTIIAEGSVTAERIRTELKKESFSPAEGREVHMTVSIGVAQYRANEDMKAFVHRADQLMYQAKRNGKDQIFSESEEKP